ncbi:hypothetical protein Sdia_36200 [Streptomyces diastaticus subsp. diastaticus]|uniref:Uncharacterized protein n=1 Tax=Streptomyces diastaticus subsp. diastaticus TaxID=68040 RepID=A0ABQ1CR65_STRDI|nr:hypothetical protein Sdia_36200 [Streptomyces diastaticus subsp. diastaticus]GGU43075.1 hypothetical protein GCM10015534_52010 [Streptomyces diastaticus subsp. diastaticus]
MSDPPPVQIDLLSNLDGDVCEELAVLAQRCISGYSDDRPVSASLVRSRLTNALTACRLSSRWPATGRTWPAGVRCGARSPVRRGRGCGVRS